VKKKIINTCTFTEVDKFDTLHNTGIYSKSVSLKDVLHNRETAKYHHQITINIFLTLGAFLKPLME